MKTLWKLIQTIVVLGMAAVMGWYSFLYLEWIGIITAAYFTAIGWMLSQIWSPGKNKSEPTSGVQSLNVTNTGASVATSTGTTDRILNEDEENSL